MNNIKTWQERMPPPFQRKCCTMNCSLPAGDPRTKQDMMADCEDCDWATVLGDDRIARDAEIAELRAALAAAAHQQQEPAAKVETVVIDGHQLREALEFLNPDGEADPDQLDEWLVFGVVKHVDDDGNVATGLCCWNDDMGGDVYPLDGDPVAPSQPPKAAQDAVDAARYRWIRSGEHNGYVLSGPNGIGNFHVTQKIRDGEGNYLHGEVMDVAIDNAMRCKTTAGGN